MCITCAIIFMAVFKVYADTIIYMIRSLANYQVPFAGPDDMPAHIKSSMFGCSLTYVYRLHPKFLTITFDVSNMFIIFGILHQDSNHQWASQHGNLAGA
jgi:hypothetical protein